MSFIRPTRKIERLSSSGWQDISQYVISPIDFNIGMRSVAHDDRLANEGLYTFTINNVDDIFDVFTDFAEGERIKITLNAAGPRKVFECQVDYIDPPSVAFQQKFIVVHCIDWIGIANRDTLDAIAVQTNKRANEALSVLMTKLLHPPLDTAFDVGSDIYPHVFDGFRTKVSPVYEELSNYVLSEWGYCYVKTNGTLIFENNSHRVGIEPISQSVEIQGDTLDDFELIDLDLLELLDGDTLAIRAGQIVTFDGVLNYFTEPPEVVRGKNIINEVSFQIFPRTVDMTAGGEFQGIYTYNAFDPAPAILLPNGSTTILRGKYDVQLDVGQAFTRLDGAMDVFSPSVTGPDSVVTFSPDSTGLVYSNFVAGGDSWKWTIINNSGIDKYLTSMRFNGRAINNDQPISITLENVTSQTLYRKQPMNTVQQRYQQSLTRANAIGSLLLDAEKSPRIEVRSVRSIANANTHEMLAFMLLDIGDPINLVLQEPSISDIFFIQGMFGSIRQDGIVHFGYRTWQRPDVFGMRRLRMRTTSTAQRFAVAWSPELELFASVGDSAPNTSTSPDGITWIDHTAPKIGYAICWSPELGLFCTVGDTGAIMTSPDGIIWTSRTSPTTNNWRGVAWSSSLGLFAAVSITGTGNRVITSPDGITWTTRVSAADSDWYDICWSPELGLFVAVAGAGAGNRCMTSTDGITWTGRAIPSREWRGVVWCPEQLKFVAISGSAGYSAISSDGITWSETFHGNTGATFHHIAYSSKFNVFMTVADGISASYRVMYSNNGINWTTVSNTNILGGDATGNVWYGICWSPELEKFVIVGYHDYDTPADSMRAMTF